MGEKDFYEIHPEYEPIEPPICFLYIYKISMELYNGCKEKITYIDIDCYTRLKGIKLTQYELSLIEQMSVWADKAIEELKKEGDDKGGLSGTCIED